MSEKERLKSPGEGRSRPPMSTKMSRWPPPDKISPDQKMVLILKDVGNYAVPVGDFEGYLMSRLEERLHLRQELTALHQHIDDEIAHFRKGERLTLVTMAELQNQLRGLRQAVTRLQEALAKLERK